jgi:hypothetical protein
MLSYNKKYDRFAYLKKSTGNEVMKWKIMKIKIPNFVDVFE